MLNPLQSEQNNESRYTGIQRLKVDVRMKCKNPVLVPCANYEPKTVRQALDQAVETVGGLGWIRPGMRIGIKLNLCAATKPENAATTHPALAAALTEMLIARGAEVILGDSPGGPFTAALMRRTYEMTGMRLCESVGGVLNENCDYSEVSFPEGVSIRSFPYVDWMRNCDGIISFSKLKSHGMQGMTAATKNLYGVIPGTIKSETHFRHEDPMDFANLLVDLNEYVKPHLCLCDAVEIMEGNGPTMGTPRHLGLLLAGNDPYRLDRLGAALLGLRETEIPYLEAAKQRGLLSAAPEPELLALAAPWALKDFQRSGATAAWFIRTPEDKGLRKIGKQALYLLYRSRPAAGKDCIGCGQCTNNCPAGAIRIQKGRARITRSKCIRCFCCQEFCPTGAMKVQRSPVARLTGR